MQNKQSGNSLVLGSGGDYGLHQQLVSRLISHEKIESKRKPSGLMTGTGRPGTAGAGSLRIMGKIA